jgi:hypothetical protein
MLGKICIHYPKKKKTLVCRIVLRASIIKTKDSAETLKSPELVDVAATYLTHSFLNGF